MKKSLRGLILGLVIAIMFMSTALGAQVKKTIEVVYNSVNITVNGNKVDTDNILYEGTTYVPLRAISEMLGKEVGWDGDTNTASIDDIGRVTPNENDSIKLGNIKGNITWQYNNYVGTRPDTGANIALIPTNLSKDVDNSFFVLVLQQTSQGKDGIYTAKSDGYGAYEIQDVPVGEYYLLIFSNNTNSDMTISDWDKERLKGVFSDKDWKRLESNLKLNKYELKTIKIEENKTITESHDFGNTYF